MNPHLYLIHGWAANAAVFGPFAACLPSDWRIHAPHLPGHGGRPAPESFSVAAAAEELCASLEAPAHLFGWSLGGLVALYAAAGQPEKVKTLTLCASFAKLRAASDYPVGVQQNMFERMVGLFAQDYAKYMRQFLELQLLNCADGRAVLNEVLPDITAHGTPQALQAALDAVEQADVRPLLPEIRCPVLLVYGNKDAITPPRMGAYLAERLPHARLEVIDHAAHAPFLSHARQVADLLAGFVASV